MAEKLFHYQGKNQEHSMCVCFCSSCCESAVLINGGEKQRNLQIIGKPIDYSRTLFCCVNAVIHQSYEDDCLLLDISH